VDKYPPLIIPYFLIAASAYSLQVGEYLHPPPKRYLKTGEIKVL
jgi:hypothetical protein